MFSNLPATDSCCLRTTWLSRRNQCAGLARLNIQLIYLTSHFGGETGWDGCWGEASSSIRSATAVWFIETWVDLRNHVSFSVGRSAGASRGGHAGSWLVHSTASHQTRVWKTLGSHSRIPHQTWKGIFFLNSFSFNIDWYILAYQFCKTGPARGSYHWRGLFLHMSQRSTTEKQIVPSPPISSWRRGEGQITTEDGPYRCRDPPNQRQLWKFLSGPDTCGHASRTHPRSRYRRHQLENAHGGSTYIKTRRRVFYQV